MAKQIKLKKQTGAPVIKLQLDAKTVVSIRNKSAIAKWKQAYPEARIIKD